MTKIKELVLKNVKFSDLDENTKLLNNKQIPIARSLVGNYTTALDMAGASITLCLLDNEIKKHWDASVLTPNLRWGT